MNSLNWKKKANYIIAGVFIIIITYISVDWVDKGALSVVPMLAAFIVGLGLRFTVKNLNKNNKN